MKYIISGVLGIFVFIGVAEAAERVMQVNELNQFANININTVDAQVYRFVDKEFNNVCYYTVTQNGTYGSTECVHVK